MARLNHFNRTGKPSPRLAVKAMLRLKRLQEKRNVQITSLGFQADKEGLRNFAYLKSKGLLCTSTETKNSTVTATGISGYNATSDLSEVAQVAQSGEPSETK